VGSEQQGQDAVALTDHGDQLRARRLWREALAAYTDATSLNPACARAWEGLGLAARYGDHLDTSRVAFESAYRSYLATHDSQGAARAAMEIALYYELYRAEHAVANGWFERAGALLENCPDTPERAWLLLWRAHVHMHVRGDMSEGRDLLAGALRLNARCQIDEIDTMARGLSGLALVSAGDVDVGLRRLDEATATALAGERYRPEVVGFTCCYVLDACEAVRDLDRAHQWLEHAWVADRALGVAHYDGFCRSHHVAVLTWHASYDRAEAEIALMRKELATIAPAWMVHCDIRLGELRRRQGRAEEAARLLEPQAAHLLAMLPLAWLRFDVGDIDGMSGLVDRFLRRIGTDHARRLHALDLVVRGAAVSGDRARLSAAVSEIHALADRITTRIAHGIAAEAEAFDPSLDNSRRISRLEDALDAYELAGAPYEAVAARLRLVAALTEAGQSDRATRELETARSTASRIGATRLLTLASAAASHGTEPASRKPSTILSARELEVLGLVAQGLSNHEIGERLFVSPFTIKRHVANILTKLDLPSRAAAASYAVREGLT
jgi:DNA-binding NarL/FixJ family response regulator